MTFIKKITKTWQKHNTNFILVVLLLVFTFYTVLIAVRLENGIIPDEPYRFEVSQHFAVTWGIPVDVPIAVYYGENLRRNPYLGYWIFGRALNIYQLISPFATDRQELVFLRLVNMIFALGTVLYGFFISKELIENKWWQLLPVFLMTNTLMFVFLSGGVSYDNPTNFVCAAGILYLIRSLKNKQFITNSIRWMIFILLGSLIKYSILPLVLIMFIVWIIFTIKNRKTIKVDQIKGIKPISMVVILAVLVILVVLLYGINLFKFQSFTPACQDTFSAEICEATPYAIRQQELGLPEKLSLLEAFKRGYPEPIRYTFFTWIPEMIKRVFGIMAHNNYFPISTSYFQIALLWIIFLAFRYWRNPEYTSIGLLGIFIAYALSLIYINYNTELVFGFDKYVALQGRYIFPVLIIGYTLLTLTLIKVSNKLIKYGTLGLLVILFLYGGPIRFLQYYHSVFTDWFI